MKACRRKYIEWGAAGIGALALFLFLPDIALSSVPSGADTALCLPPNHWPGICGIRRLWHVCQEISLNSFITKGWSGHNGCRAVALGSGGVSFVGSVHGTLGVVPTVLAVAWEAGRQCGLSYPLSGTIALTGIGGVLLLCRSCMRRSWKSGLPVSILAVLSGYWLFGCGDWSSRWYNMPDLGREYLWRWIRKCISAVRKSTETVGGG